MKRMNLFLLILATLPLEGGLALTFRGNAPKVNNERFIPGTETVLPLRISVQENVSATDYFITFSAGSSNQPYQRFLLSASTSRMYYNLYDNSIDRNMLLDLGDTPDKSQVLSGRFTTAEATAGGGTVKEHSFAFIIPPDQFPEAGSFSDQVTISLYHGSPAAPLGLADSITFRLSTRQDSIIELSIVPEGSSFFSNSTDVQIDFGVLYAGSFETRDLIVRANSSYSLSVQSQNGGELAITDPLDGSRVPYQLSANGRALPLSPGIDSFIASGALYTDMSGERYRLRLSILDYGMATEGLYQDILTFTLSAP